MNDLERDPPRLAGEPGIGGVLRSLREDAPSEATDARVLAALREGAPAAPASLARRVGWAVAAIAALSVLVIGTLALRSGEHGAPEPRPVLGAERASTPTLTAAEPAPTPSAPLVEPLGTEREEPSTRPRAARASGPPEEQLILEARRALDTDLSLASARLSLHARLYPRGIMSEERDALRIEILERRGERERARAALERLRERYPGSAHVARLERILAD